MSSHAQARLRILRTLDGLPEGAPGDLTVILDGNPSPTSRLAARFVTHLGAGGLKIELTSVLESGGVVGLAGQIQGPSGLDPVLGQFRILACLQVGVGKYHANLAPHESNPEEPTAELQPQAQGSDYYEILQVSRSADLDTIHRVFHLLAQRYHPDNRETGNDAQFRLLVEAHSVLSDPEKRAGHDVQLAEGDRGRLRLFAALANAEGVQGEIRKRQNLLRLLYTRRMTNPREPALRGRELVDLLNCPIEQLEFALWFLKENKWMQRADNSAYEISWQGVEAFEAMEMKVEAQPQLSLPAPRS